jgi:hypothetical protein
MFVDIVCLHDCLLFSVFCRRRLNCTICGALLLLHSHVCGALSQPSIFCHFYDNFPRGFSPHQVELCLTYTFCGERILFEDIDLHISIRHKSICFSCVSVAFLHRLHPVRVTGIRLAQLLAKQRILFNLHRSEQPDVFLSQLD